MATRLTGDTVAEEARTSAVSTGGYIEIAAHPSRRHAQARLLRMRSPRYRRRRPTRRRRAAPAAVRRDAQRHVRRPGCRHARPRRRAATRRRRSRSGRARPNGQTPPTGCPVAASTSAASSIFALAPNPALTLRLSIRASPPMTTRTTPPARPQRQRLGDLRRPDAMPAAASATVAVLVGSTIPRSGARRARNSRTETKGSCLLIATPLDRVARSMSAVRSLLEEPPCEPFFSPLALIAAAGLAQAQSPTASLPSQGPSAQPSRLSATPNAGNDEVAARRKLEEHGLPRPAQRHAQRRRHLLRPGHPAGPSGHAAARQRSGGQCRDRCLGQRQGALSGRHGQSNVARRSVAARGEPSCSASPSPPWSFLTTRLPPWAQAPVATVQYSCEQGKSLSAEYFDGPTRTAPDGRPIPGGRVIVTLARRQEAHPAADLVGLGHPLRQRGRDRSCSGARATRPSSRKAPARP